MAECAADTSPPRRICTRMNLRTDGQLSRFQSTDMNQQFAITLRVVNLKFESIPTDCSRIADLTARFAIKG